MEAIKALGVPEDIVFVVATMSWFMLMAVFTRGTVNSGGDIVSCILLGIFMAIPISIIAGIVWLVLVIKAGALR